jgi:glycosyltransferase involved in cell wall biosynthesis
MIEVSAYHSLERQGIGGMGGNGAFRVLFLSRLAADKGVWPLMDAAEWFQEAHPSVPIQFTCAGDGPEYEALRAHAQEHGLADLVFFPGYVRDEAKYAAFREADLFVFPSFHAEGFPIAVIESLAAGLPVIYTPVGALADILGPENGMRVEVQDVSGEALAQGIWNLYQDPERRMAMGAANRQLAQQFDVKVVCAETVKVYRLVAKGK